MKLRLVKRVIQNKMEFDTNTNREKPKISRKVTKIIVVLVVALIISILIAISVSNNKVRSATYSFINLEIVEVKQQKAEGRTGEFLVTIKNAGSSSFRRLPSLYMELGNPNDRVYLEDKGYYQELKEADVYFYVKNCVPAGEEVQIVYAYDSSLTERLSSSIDARIVLDTYSSERGKEEDYLFEFIPN